VKHATLIAVAVAVLAAGVWWWARDRSDDRPAPAPTTAPREGARAPAPVVPRAPVAVAVAGRVDPPIEEPAPPPAPDSVPFDREVRDPAWAGDQERELRLRLDRLGDDLAARGVEVAVTAAECRRSLCRFELSAKGNAELSALYGALETPEGVYGWADAVLLQDVETDLATTRVTTAVVLQFDR
jgi:hypothetical protein